MKILDLSGSPAQLPEDPPGEHVFRPEDECGLSWAEVAAIIHVTNSTTAVAARYPNVDSQKNMVAALEMLKPENLDAQSIRKITDILPVVRLAMQMIGVDWRPRPRAGGESGEVSPG